MNEQRNHFDTNGRPQAGFSPEPDDLSVRRLLGTLRRRWWIIALATVLVTAASLVFSLTQRKQYTATASIVFQGQQLGAQAAGLTLGQVTPDQNPLIMATDVQLVRQAAPAMARTAAIIGHGLTAADVSRALSVSQQGQTSIADIAATNPDPVLATRVANTFATQFVTDQRASQQNGIGQGLALLQTQIKALSPQQRSGLTGQALLDREESLRILNQLNNGGVDVVSLSGVPTSPSSPQTRRNLALGLALGLLLGLGLAFLVERLDRRLKEVDEIGDAYGLPVLAAVPRDKIYAARPSLDPVAAASSGEVFKLLRAYLRYFNVDRELKVLLITSAAAGDGKTTISRNLAEAAQETGTRTLLLEADLRRPTLASHYGLASSPGLSELLSGGVELPEAVQQTPIELRVNGTRNEVLLDVLTSGHVPPNPAELLQSVAMSDLLSAVAGDYELVVIDTPPLGHVADAMSLLQNVDGVVLVSQLGRTTRDTASVLRDRLVAINAPLLGVVANAIRTKGGDGYDYGLGYETKPRHEDQHEDHPAPSRPRVRPFT